ncbi:CobW/HypB/UreG, nucleotide-binding domain-containing protein [Crassisporium funariophilum]|nr:CobW/HypB/UreG, nucleotide-binding domain-containing protein [Crassisporium funariophilum]
MTPIPITVFTGFLGAGKTSLILSLLPRLPKDYKVVLLKNEFGDVEVDSKLAQQSSLAAVSEILNGCMCCVLVGQMQNALLEIRDKYRPDRILIECSGSAFPATLAFQIRQLERDTAGDFSLDGIVTVIDAENFVGYEDTSPTAKMQASYSDIILVNKWEHVSERALDIVMDHLHTLNDLTPKIKCQRKTGVDPELIFGLQSKLFMLSDLETNQSSDPVVHDEVETITVFRGGSLQHNSAHNHHEHEEQLLDVVDSPIEKDKLMEALHTLSRDCIWRAKGFVKLSDGTWWIINWAFGRYELTEYGGLDIPGLVRITVMGSRGEVRRSTAKFAEALGSIMVA